MRKPAISPATCVPANWRTKSGKFNLARFVIGLGLLCWLLAGYLAVAVSGANIALADDGPAINARTAIVVDATTGGILYSKDMHRRLPMASTTKIMTALTALSVPGVDLNETYTAVKEDLVGEASMGLKAGEQVTFQDLLYGMLLNSGNDAAMAVARYAGSKLAGSADPVARFVAQMNQNAQLLGLRNSHYANPHGLDQADHYTSAFDMAITGWYALHNPVLTKVMATRTATIAGHPLSNLNPLLKSYAGANGVKPGFTDNAGLCLIGSATRDGQTVIAVIMGDDNHGYAADPPALLDYGFAQLKLPDVQQNLQQGATGANAANYIGRPNGDKLVPLTGPVAVQPGTDGVIQAQISGAGSNLTGSVPAQTDSSGGTGGGPSDSSTAKKDGGFNLFGFLFWILVLVGIIYLVLRFTPALGDRGKNIAYTMEDWALRGWELLQSGVQRLWAFVRPGNHEEEAFSSLGQSESFSAPPSLNTSDRDRSRRVENVIERGQTSRYAAQTPAPPPVEEGQAREIPATPEPPRPTTRPAATPTSRDQNPLGNIFDDIAPFSIDEDQPAPQPPRPLSNQPATPAERPFVRPSTPTPSAQPPRPFGASSAGNTAFEPVEQPIDRFTKRASERPVERPVERPADPAIPSLNTELRPPAPIPPTTPAKPAMPAGDSLSARARQAIDYAYAGRLVASSEEFRKVVEQEPLYDFGSIEGFEEMPVTGFKALATAYRDTDRPKFAVLLLDLAIERYPNDLELRNMQRTIRQRIEK